MNAKVLYYNRVQRLYAARMYNSTRKSTAVKSDLFETLDCAELGAMHNCSIAEISKKVNWIIRRGPYVCLTEHKAVEYFEETDKHISLISENFPNQYALGPYIIPPWKAWFTKADTSVPHFLIKTRS